MGIYEGSRLFPTQGARISNIFVPGRGMVSSAEIAVDRAVREYDERATFGMNPATGQWTIFVKQPPRFDHENLVFIDGGHGYPVLAFRELPSPEFAIRRMRETDTMRHGMEMLDRLHRHNNALKQAAEERSSEAAGIVAEAQESYLHDQGMTSYRRVLRPMKQTAVRGH